MRQLFGYFISSYFMIMNRLFIFLIFIFTATGLVAQSYKTLQAEATQASEQGNFLKAIELSEKALAAAAIDSKIKEEEQLALRSENAAYYLLNEQVDKGLALFEPLIIAIKSGNYAAAEIHVRQNYGIALVFLSYYRDALPQLERVYELSKTQAFKREDLVNTLGSLAMCYQYQYDFVKAERIFKEALALCKKENMQNSVENASLLSNLAYLYRDMQLPVKAFECYAAAEKIFIKTSDTINPQFPAFLMEYGSLFAEAAQYEKALTYTFRAKQIDQQLFSEQSTEYAGILNNLGFIYGKMNRIIETEQFYKQAITIKKNLKFVRPESYLTTVSNLMVFCNSVGRKEEVAELAKELEAGLKNKNFTDTLKRATFANNLALEYMQAGNYKQAYIYFKDALLYYETVYGSENEFAADIYIDMGTLFQVQEKYDDCALYLNKAAGIYSKSAQEESPDKINTICNLVILLHTMGQFKVAEPYVNKALYLSEKFNVTNASVLEQLYMAKAQIAADLDQVKEAMDYFNKYLDLKYNQLEQNFSYMTENEKLFFMEQFELNIKNFYTIILNNFDKYPELIKTLLDFRLKTKGFLLNNLSKIRQKINDLHDPALNEKFEQLKLKRETVSKLLAFDTNEYPYALAEATALKTEADQLEKEISLQVSVDDLNSFKKNGWKQIQALLAPGEAAIEIFQSYLMYDNNQGKGTNYTYLIIKQTGDPIVVSIDRKIGWEAGVLRVYRNSIEAKKDEPDLYRRLWKPVDEKLQGISTVYISPDGIYNQINLNTLLNGDTKKYLLEEKNIHLLTGLRDLQVVKNSALKKPSYCVLVGNPTFDYDITKLNAPVGANTVSLATRGAYGFVLSELPGTKEEVNVIETTLEKNGVRSVLLTEENANERDIKKIKDPDVLHIATHGFFLEDAKEEDLAGYANMEKEYYKNPMIRSGIFFSGANKTYAINTANINAISDFEDGMLTADEAMHMSLDKTSLVVLSACETGLGKVKNGEGVYGLQRAFKLAGAKAIIMSLWPVSDEATKDLMISFYSNWTKTGDLYNAFKLAQLEVKKKYPQPYYWGAFVLNQ